MRIVFCCCCSCYFGFLLRVYIIILHSFLYFIALNTYFIIFSCWHFEMNLKKRQSLQFLRARHMFIIFSSMDVHELDINLNDLLDHKITYVVIDPLHLLILVFPILLTFVLNILNSYI